MADKQPNEAQDLLDLMDAVSAEQAPEPEQGETSLAPTPTPAALAASNGGGADKTRNRPAVLAGIAKRGTVLAGCEAGEITRTTFYEWKNKDPEFAAAVADAFQTYADTLEHRLDDASADGDHRWTTTRLKALRPAQYGDRVTHQHDHAHRSAAGADLTAKLQGHGLPLNVAQALANPNVFRRFLEQLKQSPDLLQPKIVGRGSTVPPGDVEPDPVN